MKLIQLMVLSSLLSVTSLAFAADARYAFATSVTGTANLSSWPYAEGQVGLVAADNICTKSASLAGLNNSQNFVAWLSDTNDDAYCRVQGLSGKRSANCGKAQLPVDAGPWLRTDGVPAAGALGEPDLVGAIVTYTPLWVDESGQAITSNQLAWTSSASGGIYNSLYNCGDMTSTEGNSFAAALYSTSWESFNGIPCNSSTIRLMCFEKFSGSALIIPEPSGNIAFLTDVAGSGDLASWADADVGTSGIEAADSICNNIAAANDLPWQDTYKAWLSDSSVEARDRFSGVGPWHRLDGIKVAENAAGLAAGSLLAPINYTDQGRYLKNLGAWTGTNSIGTRNVNHCSDWTVESGTGRSGRVFLASGGWTTLDNTNCSTSTVRLYCLSDSDLTLFSDGFETE